MKAVQLDSTNNTEPPLLFAGSSCRPATRSPQIKILHVPSVIPRPQAGLSDISSRLGGLRAMVASVAQATECPTLFIIAPELPPRQALQVVSGDTSGRVVLTDWLDDLKLVGYVIVIARGAAYRYSNTAAGWAHGVARHAQERFV